jgi:dipeptidyl aminopeptidase/acylaminoacyl peptidase
MRSLSGALALAILVTTPGPGPAGAQAKAEAPRPASAAANAPFTDIFLVDLSVRGGQLQLGRPQRITDREGYDNQPAFSPDGRWLYFTAASDGQTDVQRYDLMTRETGAFARSSDSEFSPTPAPDGGLSVVRVEADGVQRLWRLRESGEPELLLPDVKGVGYHAWVDASTLVLYVLGQPNTLQLVDRRSGKAEVMASGIGRCIRPVPGRATVSFVRQVSRGEWWLEELDPRARKTARLARLPEGVEHFAWLPDGRLVASQGQRLLELAPGRSEFRELARYDDPALQGITRLAVSPRGDRLALASDEARPFDLGVDSIMRGVELVGYPPSGLRFSGDSKELFFEWRRPGDDEPATYVVPRSGGEPRRLSDEERKLAPAVSCEWDKARRACLFVQDGDVVLVDTVARTRRVLAGSTSAESSPRFAANETAVTFVRDNNLFRIGLGAASDVLVQLTDAGPKKKEPKLTESQRFLKEEERKLLRSVEEAAARRKRAEEKKEREAPPKFELAEGQSIREGALSGDGRHAFLLVAQRADGAKIADVPSYVTESAYTEEIATRTNVGDRQESRRLAVLDLQERKRVWAFVDGVTFPEPEKSEAGPESKEPETQKKDAEAEKKKPGAAREPRDEAAASQEGAPAKDKKPEAREVRWGLPIVSPGGARAVAAVRAADNKDRWLVLIDPATGKGRVLDRQHDDAWVREGFAQASGPSFGWLDDRTLWFTSEATGYSHLYSVDTTADPAAPRALTSGEWEIESVQLSPKRDRFYLTTTEAGAAERHLYSLAVTGGPRKRLTTTKGAHRVEVSPDEATFADLYSTGRTPPEVFLTAAASGGASRQVTVSTSPEFRRYAWTDPPVVRFKARDGVMVPARLYTPESVGAARDARKPAVVFIHGAGYLQNAHHYWSSYFREYMFHHLLASRGYVVLDVDYRGSAGYGRDWRTAIAGHMGGEDLDDIVDAAGYLAREHGVDPKRIGVYGGSYGGFLTLMALFKSPDTFAAGAALRPVTDWAHYNHPYTSNILGVPPRDAEAYRRSSPIYHAEGLKSALLICHGMVDTNVHFQDSVRLAQRLIELRKENWELAAYPVENHGFEQAASWADEYKRILALFERTLRRDAAP